MIAHTLSIVKNADQILVMGDGRIAESGTHEELLAKGGKYAAMWNAEQKNPFEKIKKIFSYSMNLPDREKKEGSFGFF